MNHLQGTLINIEQNGMLHLLEFKLQKQILYILTLDLDKIQQKHNYTLRVKSTDIAIAKEFSGTLSILNQLEAKVVAIDVKKLLTTVTLDIDSFKVESVIPTRSVQKMNLTIGDSVLALIKASEISIC